MPYFFECVAQIPDEVAAIVGAFEHIFYIHGACADAVILHDFVAVFGGAAAVIVVCDHVGDILNGVPLQIGSEDEIGVFGAGDVCAGANVCVEFPYFVDYGFGDAHVTARYGAADFFVAHGAVFYCPCFDFIDGAYGDFEVAFVVEFYAAAPDDGVGVVFCVF